jgi:phosphatidylglycerophosphate synthase
MKKLESYSHNVYNPYEERVFARPISRPIAKALKNVRFITPNRLTVLRFLLAGTLVPYLVLNHEFLIAGVLVYLFFILDKVDGDLARIRNKSSSFGAYLDSVADMCLIVVYFVSVAIAVNYNNIIIFSLGLFSPIFFYYNYFARAVYFEGKGKKLFEGSNLRMLFQYNSAKHNLFTAAVLVVAPFWGCVFEVYFYAFALLQAYVILWILAHLWKYRKF